MNCISLEITKRKARIFIDEINEHKNGATFQRRINGTIVRACFRVHVPNSKHVPIFTLTFASDDNAGAILVDYCIVRDTCLHEIIKEFKATITYYQNALVV